MPQSKPEKFAWGGVDSRSNPANFPSDRALRCKNWVPQISGRLRLRDGYTPPTMSMVDGANAIHSAAYFELFVGTQYVLYGQNNALKRLALADGTVTNVATLSSGNNWGHFRSDNRLFYGNGVDFNSFDGTTNRPVGIRPPSAAEVASVTVTVTTATVGTWATTTLSGYQFYEAYYNPITGHVGNRTKIGSRTTVLLANASVVLANLQNLSGVNAEWVKALARTNDGGEVPYWLTDASGNRVTVNNTATVATLTASTVDFTAELPTRNTLPAVAFDKFCRVNTRIFAAAPNSNVFYYSEDETDAASGNFVGKPPEAWPGDNAEVYPTGEKITALHAYKFEGWIFSRNHLAVWSEFMKAQGVSPWRGPWQGGCAGQRAFVETPYGPFWISGDKQLLGYGYNGPTPASEEYEAALLAKIGDQYIAQTELTYHADQTKLIDRLYIKSKDKDGNPVLVVHDFKLRDARSPQAQGYEFTYTGMVPQTFVGAGYTPRLPVLDVNLRQKLWTGAVDGKFYQLEDGNSDNGAVYSGDYIGINYVGSNKPMVNGVEYQGDANVQFSYSVKPNTKLADFIPATSRPIDVEEMRFEFDIGSEATWVYTRIQLDSHPADGDFTYTDPPFVPMPSYGSLNYAMPKIGASRPENP